MSEVAGTVRLLRHNSDLLFVFPLISHSLNRQKIFLNSEFTPTDPSGDPRFIWNSGIKRLLKKEFLRGFKRK